MMIFFFWSPTMFFEVLQSWFWYRYSLSKMLCNICICLWQPVTMLHSAINIVVSLCFPPNNRRLIWPVLFFAPLFAFPGAVCFWPLKRWGNTGLCSHVVRPFVCFYYNKSTLSDYANCTMNVCTYVQCKETLGQWTFSFHVPNICPSSSEGLRESRCSRKQTSGR